MTLSSDETNKEITVTGKDVDAVGLTCSLIN